ncbi:hypothetical protein ABIA99_004284 [Bradyrhizobium sp. LB12.1]|uniref:hypothetical protein n=1 Tax=Bradyrhizobium sp. LB12.1 TaxID=3156327 RepID=UPI003391D7BC
MNYKQRRAVRDTIEGLRTKAPAVAVDGHISAERLMLDAADMLARESVWWAQAWRGATTGITIAAIILWLARY